MVSRKRKRPTKASITSPAVDQASGAKTTVTSSSGHDETIGEASNDKASDSTSSPPFRFLDLPAELRDEVYDIIATEQPSIVLKANGHLKVASRLCSTSHQVQGEYLAVLENSSEIVTTIERFDFRNVVRFVNRLSEQQVKKLSRLGATPRIRAIHINMEMPIASAEALSAARSLPPQPAPRSDPLSRWLNRFAVPGKRGIDMNFSYEFLAEYKDHYIHEDRRIAKRLLERMKSEYGGRAEEELIKMIAALDKMRLHSNIIDLT